MFAAALVATLVTPAGGSAAPAALGLHAGADDSLSQYEAFGTWLGRKVTHRVVFADMNSWSEIASPWFLNTSRQWVLSNPARVEVLTLPLLPANETGNFAAIVRGEHDADFASVGKKIQALGIASRVIIRLGWEGNGDWYPWAYAADPSGYRAAFRRAVQKMKQHAPALRIEWCVNAKASRRGGPATWTEGYPGDDVVDIISMDVYDEWVPSWEWLRDGEAGLNEFRTFAIQRNKPEAYSEWGCSTNRNGGGDNVAFVENMAAWFAARPGMVVYQAYWNTAAGGPKAAIFGDVVQVPNAAAAYKRLFSPPAAPTLLGTR